RCARPAPAAGPAPPPPSDRPAGRAGCGRGSPRARRGRPARRPTRRRRWPAWSRSPRARAPGAGPRTPCSPARGYRRTNGSFVTIAGTSRPRTSTVSSSPSTVSGGRNASAMAWPSVGEQLPALRRGRGGYVQLDTVLAGVPGACDPSRRAAEVERFDGEAGDVGVLGRDGREPRPRLGPLHGEHRARRRDVVDLALAPTV